MFIRNFEIRWSDMDANVHLANSAYTNYMSHTRMAFFSEIGIALSEIQDQNLGPVVLYEYMHYFKEIKFLSTVDVSLNITGLSEDGRLFRFEHNFYDEEGKNLAHCEMFGAWIDSNTRKLTALPSDYLKKLEAFPKPDNFQNISLQDLKSKGKRPIDLEL